jgi:hypothetical protein
VLPSIYIVQCVQNNIKSSNVFRAESRILDIAMVRHNIHIWIELSNRLRRNHSFGFPHMLGSKEKLPIQIGDINGIQINQLDTAETNQRQVFQNLTADSTRSHHQNLTIMNLLEVFGTIDGEGMGIPGLHGLHRDWYWY